MQPAADLDLVESIGACEGRQSGNGRSCCLPMVKDGYVIKTAHTESQMINGKRSINTKPVYMAVKQTWLLYDRLPLRLSETRADWHIRSVS